MKNKKMIIYIMLIQTLYVSLNIILTWICASSFQETIFTVNFIVFIILLVLLMISLVINSIEITIKQLLLLGLSALIMFFSLFYFGIHDIFIYNKITTLKDNQLKSNFEYLLFNEKLEGKFNVSYKQDAIKKIDYNPRKFLSKYHDIVVSGVVPINFTGYDTSEIQLWEFKTISETKYNSEDLPYEEMRNQKVDLIKILTNTEKPYCFSKVEIEPKQFELMKKNKAFNPSKKNILMTREIFPSKNSIKLAWSFLLISITFFNLVLFWIFKNYKAGNMKKHKKTIRIV